MLEFTEMRLKTVQNNTLRLRSACTFLLLFFFFHLNIIFRSASRLNSQKQQNEREADVSDPLPGDGTKELSRVSKDLME